MKMKNQMKNCKKAQMEMIGLTILAALIMMGFMLFLVMSTKTRSNDQVEMYKKITTASNFVAAIIETNTNCNSENPTVADLIADCIKTQTLTCQLNYKTYNSCEFLNITLTKILQKTLDPLKIPYYFQILVNDDENHKIYYRISHCANPANSETIPFALPLTSESDLTANLELHICHKYSP